jgi:hypothetical protein
LRLGVKFIRPNRPTQNEYRKRFPVRQHPLSCDFSATSQISVIAQPRACGPRPVAPAEFSAPSQTVCGAKEAVSIRKQGEEGARELAIRARRAAVRSME